MNSLIKNTPLKSLVKRSIPPLYKDLLIWTNRVYDPTTHQIKSRISPQYNLTLKQGLCAGMTTLSEIAFDDLSGVTITDYGTDTATIAISGNKITCSVAGNIYYIELSNGAYLVPVATKFYDVSGNAFAPIGDSLIDFTARSDDALFWCDEKGFAVTEENEILPALVAGGGYAPSGYEMVRITATTTGASEDVILNKIKLSEDSIIFWGDGDSTALTGNTTYNNLTHTYTVAGSYQVKIAKADKVKEFRLSNNKWSDFTTYDLRNADIDYFWLNATGSGFTVDTSHMTGWAVGTNWYLYSMPAGTYNIGTATIQNWTGVDRIDLYNLIDETTGTNMMTEAEVIKVIEDIYAGRLTFTHTIPTLNIAGTNASLTDAGARAKVDHLRAGNDGVNTFKAWTINVNGYPA